MNFDQDAASLAVAARYLVFLVHSLRGAGRYELALSRPRIKFDDLVAASTARDARASDVAPTPQTPRSRILLNLRSPQKDCNSTQLIVSHLQHPKNKTLNHTGHTYIAAFLDHLSTLLKEGARASSRIAPGFFDRSSSPRSFFREFFEGSSSCLSRHALGDSGIRVHHSHIATKCSFSL